ncbi:UDP-glucuronosyltransferase-like, partial [Asbolus verrucosus]
MTELALKGHDITVISPFENKNPQLKNSTYRDIVVGELVQWMQAKAIGLRAFHNVDSNPFSKIRMATAIMGELTQILLAHENVQELINSQEKFDLVIISEVSNKAHMALATHFEAPLILFSTVGPDFWLNPSVGNPAPPSYVPDIFLDYSGQLTFFERLLNSLVFVYNQLYFNFHVLPKHNEFIKKYIPNSPEINQVLYNVSLVLLNSHPSINQPVPFVPSMIEIGGFHITPPKKLPTDLQKYLDNGSDGVIYFSMGSNLKSSDLPIEKREIFLKTFAKLKQKILWKWEDDVLPGQPSNVKLSKWLPQQDILAHPNIKLFITHGGLLSTIETVYHGVPVLVMPIFGDQKLNAKIAVNNGFGLSLSFSDLNEEQLTQNIKELLHNPKYYNNAKKRAEIFHDRLVSPMETALYWIEYVIKHKGAPHLRVAALDLPWYKYLLLDVISFVRSARILGIYPLPGHSHYLLGSTLFKELAERGHDVTVINTFGEKNPPKNGSYRDILLTGLWEEKPGQQEWNMFKREGLNPFVSSYVTATLSEKFVELTLNHENVQKLLKSGEKFDVVITDQFLTDAFKAFAIHFDAPLIALCPGGPTFWINPLVGNPSPSSYIPNVLLAYPSKMTFYERMMNSLTNVFNEILYNFYYFPKQNELVKKYISNDYDLYDILYNVSLVLLNSHPSLHQPVPHVPNMVEIGGFHIKPPQKLPKDLQEFMDSADEGVIYFSMGSNLKSVQFPSEKRDAFIKAFSKLKQKILWKWEDDVLPEKPPNVKLLKWAPQRDLLAHPNLKLFITHGGFTSSVESAYNGVPVLVIPIFGDQGMNAYFAYENGFGRFITFRKLSEETILENINEMLNNVKYRENAKKRSKIFHDRHVNPMDTAVYWVEYIIRHRGAPHLRVAALDLPWYKYYLLDVIESARILTVFALPGRSHYILGSSLARALAEKGHDVTMISAFSEKIPPKNGTYRDIIITGALDEIQAHPNLKLFITHCGLSSTTETIYHGVPILAIPIFGDQKLNAKIAIDNGFGLSIPYSEISEETLTRNINEILNNPKYKSNAKARSNIFHDRLVSPMDTAIYWVE